MISFPFRTAAFVGVALLVGFIGCSSSSSAPVGTASDAGTPVDAASKPDSGASVEDAGSDAAPDAADAATDSGACAVLQRCTNTSTPAVPPEISGTLADSCAASSGGADLQTRCTAFCKAGNPGFASQTTCVASATTFQCRCVNP
jgi:hypothetical protein